MARTFIRQETQVRNSDLYDDAIASSELNFETNPSNIEEDLNNIRSKLHLLQKNQGGNWWDAQVAPSALEAGVLRGVDNLNDALHAVEKKRVLRDVHNLTDVTVGGSDNFVILGAGELPSQTTAAVGAVTTLGTVVAPHGGTFGTHALDEVAGPDALQPLNLMSIVDGTTRDPILSSGRVVYGLLQGESGVTDGATITDTTTTRVQISFVRHNATGDDLEAVPAVDIQGQTINYCSRERVRLEDLNEADFLKGAIVDVGAGATTVDRQTAYTNQGVTPVDLVTNAILDLEGPGLAWQIRDDAEAVLFQIIEGSAGGTSSVQIAADTDTFDVDAAANDFLNGIAVDTGAAGTTINVGVTANQIDSGGALTMTAAGQLLLDSSTDEIHFDDSYRAGSTWSLPSMSFADSSAEWDAFEVAFGEVSLLNAITQAKNSSNVVKTCANVTANLSPDVDVSLSDGNLDAALGDLSTGDFVGDYDIYVNGALNRSGVDASANNDVYPGTDLNNGGDGQLRFEYRLKSGDVICVLARA